MGGGRPQMRRSPPFTMKMDLARLGFVACMLLVFAATVLLSHPAAAAIVSLDVLQRDGYGAADIRRPRPNVLTVMADLDGRKVALMIDSGWTGEGIALHGGGEGRAERVTIGNVQLAQVPLSGTNLDARGNTVARRYTGASGVMAPVFSVPAQPSSICRI